jgi:hypothetical protein
MRFIPIFWFGQTSSMLLLQELDPQEGNRIRDINLLKGRLETCAAMASAQPM